MQIQTERAKSVASLPVFPFDEPYSKHAHYSYLIPRAIAQAISPSGEIRIEVCIDCTGIQKGEFLYVDLENSRGDKHAHMSIRPHDNCIVLNTMRGGKWGNGSSTYVPFHGMRFWRVELALSREGVISIHFGNHSLFEYQTEMDPNEVCTMSSNISARCVLKSELRPGPLDGSYSPARDDTNRAVLIAWKDLDIATTELTFYSIDGQSLRVECLQMPTERHTWYVCSLSGQEHAAQTIQKPIEFRLRDLVSHIHDSRDAVALEVSWSDLALRVSDPNAAIAANWKDHLSSGSVEFRLVAKQTTQANAFLRPYLRCLTPLSEFIRLSLPQEDNKVGLFIDGQQFYSVYFGPRLISAAEGVFDAALATGPQIENDWQLIILDWWSAFRDRPELLSSIELRPEFLSYVRESKLEGKSLEGSGESKELQLEPRPSAQDVMLWNVLRNCAQIISEADESTHQVQQLIIQEIDTLPQESRYWALLFLADRLVVTGYNEILNSGISDAFLADSLTSSAPIWRKTSALAVMAVRGRFSECADLLEGLTQDTRDDFNYDAIHVVFVLARRHRVTLVEATRLSNSLYQLIGRLKFREFSGGRHIALLKSLLEIVLISKRFPDSYQYALLSFLSAEVSTVPEFWQLIDDSAAKLQFGAISEGLLELATRAKSLVATVRNLKPFDAFPDTAGILRFDSGSCESERSSMLNSVLDLHTSLAQIESTSFQNYSKNTEGGDKTIRLLAHPCFEATSQLRESIGSHNLQASIGKLQSFPELPHKSVLKAVGAALLRGDRDPPQLLIDAVAEIDSFEDDATESVLLDAMAWWSTSGGYGHRMLYSLATRLIGRITKCAPGKPAMPGIQSAALRLVNFKNEFHLDVNAFYLLNTLERLLSENDIDFAVPALRGGAFFSDTLVAVYTCQKYLNSRAQECRETWVKDLECLGIPVLFFCGSGDNFSETRFDEETSVVYLPVGDNYEDLPSKSFEMFNWILRNRSESYVLKIDDDCFLDVENYFGSLAYRTAHYFGRGLTARADSFVRTWHQTKSSSENRRRAIDTSPIGSRYADGGGSYSLSRFAMSRLEKAGATHSGQRFRVGEFYEDKLIGDLLKLGSVDLSDVGYTSLQARRTHGDAAPVLQIDRTFFPSQTSGISVAHLDTTGVMGIVHRDRQLVQLRPGRIWPLHEKLSLAFKSNQLEVLSSPDIRDRVRNAKCLCVCVVRNELAILPHFLNHYRMLGIDVFFFIDNLSDDGSREFLLSQHDAIVFSAANDYRDSHFGVDWQRALLDNFCIGKWVVVADADEFIVPPNFVSGGIVELSKELDTNGFDSCLVLMVDMYPRGSFEAADFRAGTPWELASSFDRRPVVQWAFNRGPFGNLQSYVSSLRHRLMPLSPPQRFTAQKYAFLKYNPLVSLSEGLHFAAGLNPVPRPIAFLHYKYSADFVEKARREVARGQHFSGAEEYRAYLGLAISGMGGFWDDELSRHLETADPSLLDALLVGIE